ncbi:ATP-binding protein [Kitasatospora sp. GP82]|uniref:ATP-binding protein n=1 Tax=Kitasatospora sp. GP82 TaxID=3035089 RepID=UPI002476F44A|nr:ATP-binding protein [Kitasatospora sp. GP82]MDH6123459.1 hypothetical protein [Kitasatospora sp. GP82]
MTTATATAPIERSAARRVARRDLSMGPGVGCRARDFVSDRLGAWGLAHLIDTAEGLITELVNNVHRHTGCTRTRVLLDLSGPVVRIGVRDSSGAYPVLITAGPDDENGRGIDMVAKLSHRWGIELEPRGKVVWFELRTGDGRGAHQAAA